MNEIAIPPSFEQKMKDRIKDSIGELITDDELTALVISGINEAFFKPTKIQTQGWNSTTKEGPCLMTSILTDLLNEQVKVAAEQWIVDNQDMLTDMLEGVVKDGVGKAALGALDGYFKNQLLDFQINMQNQLQQQ